jgi:hypothetical protein
MAEAIHRPDHCLVIARISLVDKDQAAFFIEEIVETAFKGALSCDFLE